MLPEGLAAPVKALFSICVAAAAMETLTRDRRSALAYRSLCALAVTVCALRMALRLLRLE